MSDSKSRPRGPASPLPALQAAMSDAATDPIRRALWLDALEQKLRPCLPPALSPHCRLGNVVGGKLVFIVDSPVWHAKLRLAAPELINVARSVGLEATEVVAKTAAAPTLPRNAAGQPVKPMSEASRAALKAALLSLDGSTCADAVGDLGPSPQKPAPAG
ncbi:MAG: DUF721 domain-containing protein [Pseudoxanthomonas sp.]|nr:DUF721 domain-containing protein [Pseudoxanthomonas sp.]